MAWEALTGQVHELLHVETTLVLQEEPEPPAETILRLQMEGWMKRAGVG